MLKSYRVGWWGGGGGPCDYCVSPSPFDLDFGTLDFGTSDSGLTICFFLFLFCYTHNKYLSEVIPKSSHTEKSFNIYQQQQQIK